MGFPHPASPQVAGLAAYLRARLSPESGNPFNIKRIIGGWARRLTYSDGRNPERIIYRGRYQSKPPGCKRDLSGRQSSDDGDSCPLPGNPGNSPRGPPVVYKPGPPSPLCTENCGRLCSGYYCNPTPTGIPPDFTLPSPGNPGGSPTDFPTLPPVSDPTAPPGQTCLSSTTATYCNGGPRGGVCQTTTSCASFGTTLAPTHLTDLPTLPPSPEDPPYSGDGCASYTSTTRCQGNGGQSACVTQELCVPTPPCAPTFAPSGTPVCESEYPLCLRTKVVTRCALVTARNANLLDGDSLPAATPTPTGFITLPSPPPPPAPEAAPAEQLQSRNPADTHLLFPRQNDCDSANGGCDYLLFCDLCAKLEMVPCLDAYINAHTAPFEGTEVQAFVTEDGIQVCAAKISCGVWDSNCNGIPDFDCGNGYRISWRWNFIRFTSPKYDGAQFPLYLQRSTTDKLEFCCKFFFDQPNDDDAQLLVTVDN